MGSNTQAILLLVTMTIVQQHFVFVRANPAARYGDDTESVVMDNPLLSGSRGIRKNAVQAMAPAMTLHQKDPAIVYSGLQRYKPFLDSLYWFHCLWNAFSLVTEPPPSEKCSSTIKDVQLPFRKIINGSSSDLKQFLTDILDKGESDLTRECSKNNGEALATVQSENKNIISNHQWSNEKFKL